jgi:hypothetical protein
LQEGGAGILRRVTGGLEWRGWVLFDIIVRQENTFF